MSKKPKNVYIIGAGFFGLTIAECVARNEQLPVTIFEKRNSIGGNASSYVDQETNIEVHEYGTHIFHTSNQEVINYVTKFSEFSNYEHKVWSMYRNKLYEFPINLNTINEYFHENFTSEEAEKFIISLTSDVKVDKKNLEGRAISILGKELYDAFIKGYTEKQWQSDPKLLSSDIISRIPFSFEKKHNYFSDTFQGLPKNGYQRLFSNMTSNPLISIYLDTDYFDVKNQIDPDDLVIYTGPIDKFFNYVHGHLGWRTLDFEREILDTDNYQNAPVINYPETTVPFTRIHEFKHLYAEREYTPQKTLIFKEFSRFAEGSDAPYYPIKSEQNLSQLKKYRIATKEFSNVIFGGRLGTYQYLDMDVAIASALSVYRNKIAPRFH